MHSENVLLHNSCMYYFRAPRGQPAGSAIKTINPLWETHRGRKRWSPAHEKNKCHLLANHQRHCLISLNTSLLDIFKSRFSHESQLFVKSNFSLLMLFLGGIPETTWLKKWTSWMTQKVCWCALWSWGVNVSDMCSDRQFSAQILEVWCDGNC